ncbi:MFS transporter [Aestuariimicrobium sp. Y1814]|uniref:MFS transporter n=1 Tax=Aestuariimicrobium sp. Y1814 TaxID=3418742 RepID=UPI003DA77B9C
MTEADHPTPDAHPAGVELRNPDAVDTSRRPPEQRRRTFHKILLNTGLANITTGYLWFALVFWIYLETRNVIATGVLGGGYMLALSVSSISFGTLVDRFRKLTLMRWASMFTLGMFAIAASLFFLAPEGALTDLTQHWIWLLGLSILLGAVVENMRNIALSTTVTILIDPDERAQANGLVGVVGGLAFMVTSVLSGISVGQLGMGWTMVIAVGLTFMSWGHLLTLTMPEEVEPAASDAQGNFDLAGAWKSVSAVPGLFALIIFSTFNNLVGGVYSALLDPYGLEIFSVELWGILFAVAGTGFLVGGAIIGKFGLGKNPLRTMLLCVVGMGLLGAVFTIREWGWLFMVGIWIYMVLIPAIEAAEQTVIQRVVPLERQGRVFGFAGAVELAAAPFTAFLIAPIAELWILPWSRSEAGAAALRPLLGEGTGRGIALVFLVAGLVMVLAAVAAFFTPVYRQVSRIYAEQSAKDAEEQAALAATE